MFHVHTSQYIHTCQWLIMWLASPLPLWSLIAIVSVNTIHSLFKTKAYPFLWFLRLVIWCMHSWKKFVLGLYYRFYRSMETIIHILLSFQSFYLSMFLWLKNLLNFTLEIIFSVLSRSDQVLFLLVLQKGLAERRHVSRQEISLTSV